MEALGASWVVFWVHVVMLVFGVVFKSAPGGFLAGSLVDFSEFGRDLGKVLGWIWSLLGLLGCFGGSFFMLVFGVVFKSALGTVWLGFWFDFNGFWEDFGKVLEGFWEGLGRMCEHSG